MIFNVDKKLFDILQAMDIEITWEDFRAAYAVRKAQRERDPEWTERRKRNASEQAAIAELFDKFMAEYRPAELDHSK